MAEVGISARNRFAGQVVGVVAGMVSSEIQVRVSEGVTLTSVVTQTSLERLRIEPGREVLCLIKASSVLLSVGAEAPVVSTRNRIKGVVERLTDGDPTAEVIVRIADGVELVSVVTHGSVERLGIGPGKAVWALVKASNVLLARP